MLIMICSGRFISAVCAAIKRLNCPFRGSEMCGTCVSCFPTLLQHRPHWSLARFSVFIKIYVHVTPPGSVHIDGLESSFLNTWLPVCHVLYRFTTNVLPFYTRVKAANTTGSSFASIKHRELPIKPKYTPGNRKLASQRFIDLNELARIQVEKHRLKAYAITVTTCRLKYSRTLNSVRAVMRGNM